MKENYQLQLTELLSQLKTAGGEKKLALHCCCAPCSSYVLKYLTDCFCIDAVFYNPNITSESEYIHRLSELQRLVGAMPLGNSVTVTSARYCPDDFRKIAEGLEHCPERGERCLKCYALRLDYTARHARQANADYFATTLTLSPLKSAEAINKIGQRLGEKYGVQYLPSDFKKNDGYKQSIELSAQYSLYRQNFCGCEYSRNKPQ